MKLMPAERNLRVLLAVAIATVCTIVTTPLAQAQFSTLYEFTGKTDGGSPYGPVWTGPYGFAFGTTLYGGNVSCNPPLGCGVLYKIDSAGHEQAIPFLGGQEGASPYSNVVVLSGLGLGTTSAGGGSSGCFGNGCGTLYSITPQGHKRTLYAFTGGADGGMPFAGLTTARNGNVYGTTTFGGDLSCGLAPPGCGVIYQFDFHGHMSQLYSFTGGSDGAFPLYGNLATDGQRHLYGATQKGGDMTCNPPFGCGVIFDYDGFSRHTTPLHQFGEMDGQFPESGVTLSGNKLFGTTGSGGTSGMGTVFSYDLTTKAFGVLHSFAGGTDGASPIGGVAVDPSGNVYGTTESGGQFGFGTLYSIDAMNRLTVMHDFSYVGDGGVPVAGPIYAPVCPIFQSPSPGGPAPPCLMGSTSQSSEGSGTIWWFLLL